MKRILALLTVMSFLIIGCAAGPKKIQPSAGEKVIRFQYELEKVGGIHAVFVSGAFNQWRPTKDKMWYDPPTRMWTADVAMKPGKYEYKFVINGETWVSDPNAKLIVEDPYGGKNGVVVVE